MLLSATAIPYFPSPLPFRDAELPPASMTARYNTLYYGADYLYYVLVYALDAGGSYSGDGVPATTMDRFRFRLDDCAASFSIVFFISELALAASAIRFSDNFPRSFPSSLSKSPVSAALPQHARAQQCARSRRRGLQRAAEAVGNTGRAGRWRLFAMTSKCSSHAQQRPAVFYNAVSRRSSLQLASARARHRQARMLAPGEMIADALP